MSRIFLGTSFSGHVNYETGQVHDGYRREVEQVILALRKVGNFSVFCAVEHEDWIIRRDIPARIGVEKDLAEIDECDVMLALLPPDIISAGLQYEVGYADAKDKRVLLATYVDSKLGYFNEGAVDLGRVQHLQYENPSQLAVHAAIAIRA